MKTAVTISAYGLGLLALFGAAFGVGAVLAPGTPADTPGAVSEDHTAMTAVSGESAEPTPGGLMVSQDGYTLVLADRTLPPGAQAALRFTVTGPDGSPVTAYRTEHDQELHLIAVRRDLTDFQHVHPVRAADGTWNVPLNLPSAGEYRIFADFTPVGHAGSLVLGADLSVPGDYLPQPLQTPASTAELADGYAVTLQGDVVPGVSSELTLTVSRDGAPVTDLEPYLAAYGHLVALRAGDLAYLHVHPAGEPGDGATPAGPAITFYADVPTAGDYRLYLDFQHQGVVRTAAFAVHIDSANPSTSTDSMHGEGG